MHNIYEPARFKCLLFRWMAVLQNSLNYVMSCGTLAARVAMESLPSRRTSKGPSEFGVCLMMSIRNLRRLASLKFARCCTVWTGVKEGTDITFRVRWNHAWSHQLLAEQSWNLFSPYCEQKYVFAITALAVTLFSASQVWRWWSFFQDSEKHILMKSAFNRQVSYPECSPFTLIVVVPCLYCFIGWRVLVLSQCP